jgi:hypothetical protein
MVNRLQFSDTAVYFLSDNSGVLYTYSLPQKEIIDSLPLQMPIPGSPLVFLLFWLCDFGYATFLKRNPFIF